MDGGGLKGTGTASIKVKDINDMPPSFTKQEWVTEVTYIQKELLKFSILKTYKNQLLIFLKIREILKASK